MSPDPETPEYESSPAPDGDVWLRLREQMELVKVKPGMRDPVGLAARLSARAKVLRLQMARPEASGPRITFLAFSKQRERYGMLLDEIAAVESLDHFTPVPNVASFIRGVTPWRGSILSLVDLGRFFGRPESGIADLQASVIVETAGRRLAVVASEVEEIFSVPAAELAAAPEMPGKIAPEWIIGIHDENRLILRMSEIMKGIAVAQRAST